MKQEYKILNKGNYKEKRDKTKDEKSNYSILSPYIWIN